MYQTGFITCIYEDARPTKHKTQVTHSCTEYEFHAHVSSGMMGPKHGLQPQKHSNSLPKIIHYIYHSNISHKNIQFLASHPVKMFGFFTHFKARYLTGSGPLCMNAVTYKIGQMVYRLKV
jgi:hypothetical protein